MQYKYLEIYKAHLVSWKRAEDGFYKKARKDKEEREKDKESQLTGV